VGVLREVVEADLPVFYEHQRDREAAAMAAFPARERDAFMAHWAKSAPSLPRFPSLDRACLLLSSLLLSRLPALMLIASPRPAAAAERRHGSPSGPTARTR
jgi:hypothetical protein